jgi:hypothetical protein
MKFTVIKYSKSETIHLSAANGGRLLFSCNRNHVLDAFAHP